MDLNLIFAAQLLSTLYMCGLIWFVQIVHYPLMANVGQTQFVKYQERHQQRTSYVVAPVMVVELTTAAALLWFTTGVVRSQATVGLILLIAIWLSTFLIQVPAHATLMNGFHENAHRKLVLSNWIRTIFWTIRSGIVLNIAHSLAIFQR